jgi:triacylglycerol lipase
VSNFVEIPPGQYSATAFADFNAALTDLSIGNARAMMWISQLAYEAYSTGSTIKTVAPQWGFAPPVPFNKPKTGLEGSFDTTGLWGERADAVVLAFAGTDPGVWQTVATDGAAKLSPDTDIHTGFQTALNAADDVIQQAVTKSQQTGKPLWITGHSLGAALAALAAKAAAESLHCPPKAIYLFGMPRAGGERFQAAYNGNPNLGPRSFRFVHGLDVVARVPSFSGYRHIGSVLQCKSGEKFDPQQRFSPLVTNDPELAPGIIETLGDSVENLLMGHLFSPAGPGTFGPLFKFLPQPLRDHLQDRYWTALTPAG